MASDGRVVRWRSAVVLTIVGVLVLAGCPGDAALEEDFPFFFVIRVPKDEQPQRVRFGRGDVEALGLDQSEFLTSAGPNYDRTRIETSLRESDGQRVEYCFKEPVTLVSDDAAAVIVEPGECVDSGRRVLDRADVDIESNP